MIQENIKNDGLIFYEIMGYPLPIQKDLFSLEKKSIDSNDIEKELNDKNFSRNQKNQIIIDYVNFINKFGRLYKSIPFVKHIYLCNSISFNALKEDSDIDIFIITKKRCLRRARFFSRIFFTMFFLKRGKINKKKKFCLSFYTTEDNVNLYNISLPKSDIYLVYWLFHLVPLYQEENYNIYGDNNWIYSYLPNLPKKHIINIGNKKFIGNSKTKKFIEKLLGGYIGLIFEYLIKSIRLPIVIHKKNNLKDKGRGIIINDKMLKFHQDIRKKIYFIFKSHKSHK